MKTQLLELAARYTRHCLYRWQHHMGDFSGSPACCNLWDLIQAALGEASKSPQVPFGLVLSTVCAEMEFKRKLVQLYPCPCCAVWNVDEWWLDDGRIVKAQRVMEVLSVEEAVMELDFSGSQVVMFRHAGHGGLNVVYRRPDGNIGWIDPALGAN